MSNAYIHKSCNYDLGNLIDKKALTVRRFDICQETQSKCRTLNPFLKNAKTKKHRIDNLSSFDATNKIPISTCTGHHQFSYKCRCGRMSRPLCAQLPHFNCSIETITIAAMEREKKWARNTNERAGAHFLGPTATSPRAPASSSELG